MDQDYFFEPCPVCQESSPVTPTSTGYLLICRKCKKSYKWEPTQTEEEEEFSWRKYLGAFLTVSTILIPVLILLEAGLLEANHPGFFICLGLSALGGAIGVVLFYPEKGFFFLGLFPALLIGPGVYAAFLIYLQRIGEVGELEMMVLCILGAFPGTCLYYLLLLSKGIVDR